MMKIIIENESLENQTEIEVDSFSLLIGKYRTRFAVTSDGKLKIYGVYSMNIEPRGSNSIYIWSVE